MTKWLGMSVIAEGVEKKEQADYLASIGCKYIQGYLYSKPTLKADFEKLLKSSGKEEKILKLETVEHLDNNAFWDPKSMDSLIFNSYIGSACIFEYHSGRVELLRVSKKYTELVESAGMPIDTALALNWTEHLGESDRATLSAALNESAKTYSEVTLELAFTGLNTQGRKTYLRSTMRVIVSTGDRYLVYCLAENMTAQREAERNERRVMQQLQAVMENVNCGITAVAISGDKVEYQLANDKYFDIIGYSREEFFGGNGIDPFTTIDKADIEYVQATISRVAKTGKPESMEYRGIHKGGRRIWLRSHISMTNFVDKGLVQLTTYTDITEEKETKSHLETLTENIPGGIASFEFEGGSMKLAYFNDGFLRLFGLSRREYTDFTQDEILRMIDKDDLPQLKSQIAELKNDGKRLDAVFRVHLSGGGFKWLNLKASRSAEGTAAIIINSVVFDITMRQEALESLRISEEENRLAIAHSRSVVCRYDVASKTLRVSPRVNDIFTVPKNISDIPYSQIREGKVAPDSAETYIAFYNAIARGEKSGKMTFKRMSTVGWRWITANFSTIFSSDGKPVSAVISFEDVTDELEKEAVYRKWRQSLQGRDAESYSLFRCNVTRHLLFGHEEGALIISGFDDDETDFDMRSASYAEKFVLPDDIERFIAFISADKLLAAYYQGNSVETIEYRERVDGGDGMRWLRLTVEMVDAPHSTEVDAYLLFEDIDTEKREELSAIERSQNDPLTGVLSRAAFENQVNYIIETSKPGVQHALMMLDIDGFGRVNELFGHSAGDQALLDIASSIKASLRHNDLVGRLQGDEFVIFLTDIPADTVAVTKARQFCALTRKSYSMDVEISGSIGITIAPRDGITFGVLYDKADAALYYVKGSGKDNYVFYHEDMKFEHEKPEMKPEEISTLPSAAEKKRRMLIVDDSKIAHAMLTNIFASDFIVEKAKDGRTALIRLRHYGSAISVVLLDLMMPGMDGFAVLENMQQTPDLRSIPVIVVSGDENRETSLRAIRAGATDYVTKPFDASLLKVRVKAAISKAENERLRARNSVLEYRNNEVRRYRTVLENEKTIVIENDWLSGTFIYDEDMSLYLLGKYDERQFWHILLSDVVTDTDTVKRLQEAVHDLAADRKKERAELIIRLRTPKFIFHWFKAGIYKLADDFGLTGRLYIALTDLGERKP